MIDNPFLLTFALGAGSGIWASVWFNNLLRSMRSPRYYRRRARRAARGYAR